MSEFTSSLQWKSDQADFELRTFNRNHIIRFPNGTVLEGSSAPDFSGNPERNNPEQLFVASLSSCHMLTFLAMAAIGKWKVESYEDEAIGFLEKNGNGKMCMTRVVLRPVVCFNGEGPSQEELQKLHEKAHRGCFIATSVNTEILVEPPIE